MSGSGSAYTFANLTNLDGTSVLIGGGATAAFPLLTSYTNTTTINSQTRTLQASGAGSKLDLGEPALLAERGKAATELRIRCPFRP